MRLHSVVAVPDSPIGVRALLLGVIIACWFILGTGGVGGQTGDDHGDTAPTATPATPTPLSLGSSMAGRIDPGDDVDFFKLDLSSATGTTDVWLYTTGGLDTTGELLDVSEDLLASNDDGFFGHREEWTNFHLRWNLPPGVYYVRVGSYGEKTGDYTLHAHAVTDPGGATTGTAASLDLDSPTPGAIGSESEADYFRLDFTESTNIFIYATGLDLSDQHGFLPFNPVVVEALDSRGAETTLNLNRTPVGVVVRDDFGPGVHYVRVITPGQSEHFPDFPSSYPVPYTIVAYENTVYTDWLDHCEAATVSLTNSRIADPLYGCQWHLRNQEPGGEDINIEDVWADGYRGQGVNVVVVDETVDHAHEDLTHNVNTALNHDYGGRGSSFRPYEHHGTQVAGVIAARDNGVGGRGVAPRATIHGHNFLANSTDSNMADAMARNRVVTAVSNNSWGPPDGPWLGFASSLWETAVGAGVREGYGGKGTFYAFAAGNGAFMGDEANLDELANYYAVTAVCSVNDQDVRSGYSEQGANLWVCAPSDGGRRGIVTADNSDRYTGDFGGTSAATPIVSGVAALLRDANPDLTWRDLKLILAASARRNDPGNPGWEEGAPIYGSASPTDRYHFNREYGFGVVDAEAAVALARGWTNVPTLQGDGAWSLAVRRIPDATSSGPGATVTQRLALDTGIRFTEFVEIEVDFDHESIRDLEIELVSPSGSVSRLVAPFDTRDLQEIVFILGVPVIRTFYVPLDGEHRFGSAKHLGEDPNGTWELRVRDHFGGKSGTLRSWSVRVYGHARDLPYGEPDREALVALYNATDGPNWANNDNWLSDRSLGEWHGVRTDANGRVMRLIPRRQPVERGDTVLLGQPRQPARAAPRRQQVERADSPGTGQPRQPAIAGPELQPVDRNDTGLPGRAVQSPATVSGR